jgi:hypothetical protein
MAEKPQNDPLLKMAEDIGFIRGKVAGLVKSLDDHSIVHAELNTRLNKHSDAIRSLQETRAQGKGMVILGRIVSTAIGAIAGAAAAAATIASMMVNK